MTDPVTVLQAISTLVQAGAAVAIVILTVQLVGATRRYADTTRDQFEEMGRQREAMRLQLAEMVHQREADLIPAIHITSARVIEQGKSSPAGMVLGIGLRNVGKGPALSVYAHLRHPQFDATRHGFMEIEKGVRLESGVVTPRHVEFADKKFVSSTAPLLLSDGEDIEVCLRVGDVHTGSELQSEGGEVFVECRDLLGNWWRTRMSIKFGFVRTGTSNTYSNFELAAQDQTERYVRIAKPRLLQETLAVNDSPLEADEIGAL